MVLEVAVHATRGEKSLLTLAVSCVNCIGNWLVMPIGAIMAWMLEE